MVYLEGKIGKVHRPCSLSRMHTRAHTPMLTYLPVDAAGGRHDFIICDNGQCEQYYAKQTI